MIVVAAADLSVAALITTKRQQRRRSRAAAFRSSECCKAARRPLTFGLVGVIHITEKPTPPIFLSTAWALIILLLVIYQFVQDNFFCTVTDIVHTAKNPNFWI